MTMRIVVDANVMFGAFLRAGSTRELLVHAPLSYYAPQWLREEVERRLPWFQERAHLSNIAARELMESLWARIQPVPVSSLAGSMTEATRRCQVSGAKDVPYVACALAIEGILWTQDKTLLSEAGVPTITTPELVKRYLPL